MTDGRISKCLLPMTLTVAVAMAACGGPSPNDADAGDATVSNDGGLNDDWFNNPQAPPFSMSTDMPNSIQVSVSGESLAEIGYPYTSSPASADDPVFVDGWEVRFQRYLVSIDHVRLNQAGADPTMQQAVGGLVAQQDGPWLINVHAVGPNYISGAGGAPEKAVPLFVFTGPTSGGTFDATTRYAFSYDTVPASMNARNVNLTIADRDDALAMVQNHWTTFFSGTATYRGRASTVSVDPTFQNYPLQVHFRFGFGAPASYINCHNPELGDADLPSTRGIQPSATGHARAQITMHTDHFFWDQAEVHGTPLHFDPLASRAQGFGMDAGVHELTLADLMGDSPTALTDRNGMPVQDRGAQTSFYTPMGSPPAYHLNSAAGINDLRDFVVYSARTQGHLNSDGLCYVQPNGPFAF